MIRVRVIAFCVLLVASTGAWSRQPRTINLTDITNNSALIGKRVTLHACIGIPVIDNADGGEQFVVLHPCDAKLDDGPPPGTILGTFKSEQVFQPFADARITFEGEVQADFTGKLSRRVDDEEPKEYFVLTIERVANPAERIREDE